MPRLIRLSFPAISIAFSSALPECGFTASGSVYRGVLLSYHYCFMGTEIHRGRDLPKPMGAPLTSLSHAPLFSSVEHPGSTEEIKCGQSPSRTTPECGVFTDTSPHVHLMAYPWLHKLCVQSRVPHADGRPFGCMETQQHRTN